MTVLRPRSPGRVTAGYGPIAGSRTDREAALVTMMALGRPNLSMTVSSGSVESVVRLVVEMTIGEMAMERFT